MESLLYIEINLVGVLLLILILANQRQFTGASVRQRQFNDIIYATITVLAVDAVCWWVDQRTFPLAREINIAAETFYYFFNAFLPYLWVRFSELDLSADANAARAYALVRAARGRVRGAARSQPL